MSDKKTIAVLLTRQYSAFANFIYYISGKGYTHVAIALDEENEYYYSFNFKGFRREYPKKQRRKNVRSVCYKLEVSPEDYGRMSGKLKEMEQERERFHYTRLGVICCMFHIPLRIKDCYFCSQFVAEMLSMSETVALQKRASLYLPNHLCKELERQDSLCEIVYNPV